MKARSFLIRIEELGYEKCKIAVYRNKTLRKPQFIELELSKAISYFRLDIGALYEVCSFQRTPFNIQDALVDTYSREYYFSSISKKRLQNWKKIHLDFLAWNWRRDLVEKYSDIKFIEEKGEGVHIIDDFESTKEYESDESLHKDRKEHEEDIDFNTDEWLREGKV